MRASREHRNSDSIPQLYHQSTQQIEPYYLSSFQISNSNICSDDNNQRSQVSLQNLDEFFTLESAPAMDCFMYDSTPAVSVSSNRTSFSPQCSNSYTSDFNQSSDNIYGSPISASPGVDLGSEIWHVLRELEDKPLESDIDENSSCSFGNIFSQPSSFSRQDQVLEVAAHLDMKQLLVACARAVSNEYKDIAMAEILIKVLEEKVSVVGEPIQRLSAYMMEGVRAKLFSSGSIIYKNSKCQELTEPTSSELMSYMTVLYQICPYYKFAYFSSNVVISEAMENENRIHIIDFQIAQGSQWVFFIQKIAQRSGGAPFIRITGVDDSQSAHARGGGLQLVGQRLAKVAESCGVPFEFHAAGMFYAADMPGFKLQLENLHIHHGEALAVNFPYMLHHVPDESVSPDNHRDSLLRLVKSLSPKIVTLGEQECNTNTAAFEKRFCETLDYYMAMFESISAGRGVDEKQRIHAEEHCVGRDIVNIIACEGPERVERHEPFGKWSWRFMWAGFTQCSLSSSVSNTIRDILKEYSTNYRLEEKTGTFYLGWKSRDLVTFSAWR